jgi:anti-sigma regulatory factor (Ser/Thr protein kinase)
MGNQIHTSFKATDRSYFAILKKEIHALAISAGFSDSKTGEIDIVVAEIVSNLVKHGGGGQLLVRLINVKGNQGIELLSIDDGIGMTDINRMISDGVSTKSSLGQGLGAMKRLSDVFQVYSQRSWGTIILCRLFETPLPVFNRKKAPEIHTVIVPKPGETACGDGFASVVTEKEIRLFLGDGLGHGPEAQHAVHAAMEAFEQCEEPSSVDVIRHIHARVKKTRGVVGTVAIFNIMKRQWNLCGIGNILTKLMSAENTNGYMSYNGILGLNVPNSLKEREFDYEPGQHIVLCSDGIKSRWDTLRFPGISRYDMSILAAAVFKDFARNTDDMSVAICKPDLR